MVRQWTFVQQVFGPTADIADLAVTNAKVATGADAVKLADGTVIQNTELQYIVIHFLVMHRHS